MGINISVINTDGHKAPVPVQTALTCDGGHAVNFTQLFTNGGLIEQYRDAMECGWKVTYVDGERRFFGPCCSGKVPQSTGRVADD